MLAIQRDFRNAGLTDKDVAMLAYAEQIARDASKITRGRHRGARAHGFTDVEIADIAFCASFRSFLSRYFDAVGATPEPMFVDPDPAFRDRDDGRQARSPVYRPRPRVTRTRCEGARLTIHQNATAATAIPASDSAIICPVE